MPPARHGAGSDNHEGRAANGRVDIQFDTPLAVRIARRLGGVTLADQLAAATTRFLDLLDEGTRADALLGFDEQRRDWAYWPTVRRGVALHELDRRGTKAAHRLLATALPIGAFAQATTIMGLDEVLDLLEGYSSDRRHRDDYWLAVFGRPGEAVWGWRFEGHHVSVHATVVDDEVRLTPLFLGANPGLVAVSRDHAVVAPLAREEELGFELLHALSEGERSAATISATAPPDIVTRNDPMVDAADPRLATGGVPLAGLLRREPTAAVVRTLLDLYLARFPAGAARPDPRDARFGWAGADEPGVGHYYLISGPRLLIELDNTQDGANHVHTVVRDPQADFGDDLLAAHYRHAHLDGGSA